MCFRTKVEIKGNEPGTSTANNSAGLKIESTSSITNAPLANSPKNNNATVKAEIKSNRVNNPGASFNGTIGKKDIIIKQGNNNNMTSPSTNNDHNNKTLQSFDIQMSSDPLTWSILEVAQFLTTHDCAAYCEFFTKNVSIRL